MSVAVDIEAEAGKDPRPLIVGLGGTLSENSSSERALRYALSAAAQQGARTKLFSAKALDLPMYTVDQSRRCPAATALVDALGNADGIIVATPATTAVCPGWLRTRLTTSRICASTILRT